MRHGLRGGYAPENPIPVELGPKPLPLPTATAAQSAADPLLLETGGPAKPPGAGAPGAAGGAATGGPPGAAAGGGAGAPAGAAQTLPARAGAPSAAPPGTPRPGVVLQRSLAPAPDRGTAAHRDAAVRARSLLAPPSPGRPNAAALGGRGGASAPGVGAPPAAAPAAGNPQAAPARGGRPPVAHAPPTTARAAPPSSVPTAARPAPGAPAAGGGLGTAAPRATAAAPATPGALPSGPPGPDAAGGTSLHPLQRAHLQVQSAERAVLRLARARPEAQAGRIELATQEVLAAARALTRALTSAAPRSREDRQALAILRTFLGQTADPDGLAPELLLPATLREVRHQVEVLLRRWGLEGLDLRDPRVRRRRDGELAWMPEGGGLRDAWSMARLGLLVLGALGALALLLVWASR